MSEFPYRKGANAVVVDSNNLFLIVQKQNYGDNQWDFPGGGLEDDEDLSSGILRELREELGSSDFEIIRISPYRDVFEWPKESQERGFAKHGKWWRDNGKMQKKLFGKQRLIHGKQSCNKFPARQPMFLLSQQHQN